MRRDMPADHRTRGDGGSVPDEADQLRTRLDTEYRPDEHCRVSVKDVATRLLETCNRLRSGGADFPTIWSSVLKTHPYVAGLPIQDRGAYGPVLRIPLITGQHLLFESGFSLL